MGKREKEINAKYTVQRTKWEFSLIVQLVKNPPAMQESACNARDPRSIAGSGRSPGEGNGNPLQCSCLENPVEKEPGGLQTTWVARLDSRLSN